MRYQKVILLNYRFIFNQQHRIINCSFTLLQKLLFPASRLKSILLFFYTVQFCSNKQYVIVYNVIHFILLLVQSTIRKTKQEPYMCHSTLINVTTIQPAEGYDGYNQGQS